MKKMIILDIDGTISHKGKISKRVIQAIHDVREKGNIVTIASGRNNKGIQKMANKLGINDGKTPIIGLNGAEVFYMNKNGDVNHVWEKPFPTKEAVKVINNATENKVDLFIYTTDNETAYTNRKKGFFYLFMKHRTKDNVIQLKKDLSNLKLEVIKFISYGKKQRMNKFLESIKDLNLSQFGWSYVSNAKANVELNMPGINKSEGMKKATELLGIKQSDVIYFGDGGNDKEALKWAGIGVAMGNASDEIKGHADTVTKTVKEDGVADWLENNL